MRKIKLPKELTTVTPVSKFLALIIFLTFPIYGFLLGAYFQRLADLNNQPPAVINYVLQPTMTPIPTQAPKDTTSCRTNTDCPADYHCTQTGPIMFNPGTRKSSPGRTCVKNATASPL